MRHKPLLAGGQTRDLFICQPSNLQMWTFLIFKRRLSHLNARASAKGHQIRSKTYQDNSMHWIFTTNKTQNSFLKNQVSELALYNV